jgi:TRAP-type C4-dicarboxylate transport system substrate-binding protein
MVWWATEIEKRTNGQVKVAQMTWSGALLKSSDIAQGIGKDIADIGYFSVDYCPGDMPFTRAISPTFYDDGRELGLIQWQMYLESPEIQAEFRKMNLKPLFFYGGSYGAIYTNFKWTDVSELKAKKFRAVGQSGDFIANLGGTPLAIAAGDVYTALQKGTIDGIVGVNTGSLTSMKLYEVIKQVTDYRYSAYSVWFGCMMNLDKYNALPDSVKKIIDELRPLAWDAYLAAEYPDTWDGLTKCRQNGVDIVQLSPEAAKKLRDLANPEAIWEKYIKTAEATGATTVRSTLAKEIQLMDQYNAQHPRKTMFEQFFEKEQQGK